MSEIAGLGGMDGGEDDTVGHLEEDLGMDVPRDELRPAGGGGPNPPDAMVSPAD